ncbi:MAG: sigma-54-dependent Fis family transcriptional regulator [Myxococcales bacterium]|nr:sigma-54-dependent Fis family transcriptional regulator [Myxococcales bacterium]
MSADDPVEILLVPSPGAAPTRRALAKRVTTIGADPRADVRAPSLPRQWAILKQRDDGLVELRFLESGEVVVLARGETVERDGASLTWPDDALSDDETTAPRLPVERLALALGDAESPTAALRTLLRELLHATEADTGALVLEEAGDYTVPVAEHRDGRTLDDGAALLSDTLVRDVLTRGEPVCLVDAPAHGRYGEVPSVAALELRSVLCVPMVLGRSVLGAIFLGKRGTRARFAEHQVDDLRVVGSLVLPLLAQLRRTAGQGGAADYLLVGEHASMHELRRLVQKVGPSELSVLILGDTGTGKEMVARAIHHASARARAPMVALNCSAVPESLLATELFGAKRGAYTGAIADRKGVIERAHGSTLFLDELGDMPLSMQAALLRVLEERRVTRVGDGEPREVDFRLVAATHKDLEAEVAAGRFRRDLLFRLQEITLVLPSLCERGDDVTLLAGLFSRQAEKELGVPARPLSPAAERALMRHSWPGNVRELRAAMRRAALLCESETITPDDLQLGTARPSSFPPPAELLPLSDARERFVTDYVRSALERHDGNREATAAALGVSLRSLYRYLG